MILEVLKRVKSIFHYVLFTFQGIGSCKVRVRLILGLFFDANSLKNWLKVNLKVRVRLELGGWVNAGKIYFQFQNICKHHSILFSTMTFYKFVKVTRPTSIDHFGEVL